MASQNDLSSLGAKMDFVIGKQRELSDKVDFLQDQFNQSKGAVRLMKAAIWLTGVTAGIVAATHDWWAK